MAVANPPYQARTSTTKPKKGTKDAGSKIGGPLWATVWTLSAAGVLAILCYAVSTSGRHLTYVGTGVLTAFAAGLSGGFFGFLLGIPRAVSSGEIRQAVSGIPAPPGTSDKTRKAHPPDETSSADDDPQSSDPPPVSLASAPMSGAGAARFAQSTNLAEVSDWLTKLLLGAGLVSLTKLGKPTSELFHTIAAGLSPKVDGSALVMAGAIVITYVALGFMATYVGTTVWYTQLLETTE